MPLKFCRYCETPLPAGEAGGRPADFCSDEHRQRYQEKIQRETVERLRSTQSGVGGSGVLHAGPPPGLMAAPPLRGVRRDAQTATEIETATVMSRGLAPEAVLGALSDAAAPRTAPIPGLGVIEKTDNASLSNLLRQARERIASDAATTTALAVRRKPRPKARSGGLAAGANGDGHAAPVPEARVEAKPGPAAAIEAEAPAVPVAEPSPEAKAVETELKPAGAAGRVVPVRRVEEVLAAPPAAGAPVRPEAKAAAGVVSSPEAKPSLPAGAAAPVKPSSDFQIEITPPALAVPAAGVLDRVPWYAKTALVLLLAGGGGYAWWSTQGQAKPARVKRKMEEVKPLNMAPTEWTTVNATGAEAKKMGRVMTLHKASMELTDYRVEFVGTVDHRALGWAVRVQDPGNYYAAKLRKNAVGTARLSLIRWRVTNGEAGPETVLPLEMRLPSNEQYTVKVDVRGDQIVTTLQGKVIDRWTDSSLTKGGFAYLNQNNERGKIVVTTIGMVRAVR